MATDPLLAAPLMTRFPVSPLVLKVWNVTPLALYGSLPTGDAIFRVGGPIQAHFGWNNRLLPTVNLHVFGPSPFLFLGSFLVLSATETTRSTGPVPL